MSDPGDIEQPEEARREALALAVLRLRAILLLILGGIGVAIGLVVVATAPEASHYRWFEVPCLLGVLAVLVHHAHNAGAFRRSLEIPGPAPEDWREERLPTLVEWTLLVLRGVGYGLVLAAVTRVALNRLGIQLEGLMPRFALVSPWRALLVTSIALVGGTQLVYYTAPVARVDRRTSFFTRAEGGKGKEAEPVWLVLLSIGAVYVLLAW